MRADADLVGPEQRVLLPLGRPFSLSTAYRSLPYKPLQRYTDMRRSAPLVVRDPLRYVTKPRSWLRHDSQGEVDLD